MRRAQASSHNPMPTKQIDCNSFCLREGIYLDLITQTHLHLNRENRYRLADMFYKTEKKKRKTTTTKKDLFYRTTIS